MKKLLSIILLGLSISLFAQQEQQYSQYMMNQFTLNPAIAGTEDFIDVNLGFRKQWAGFESSPRTTFVTAHMALKKEFHQYHHKGEHKAWHGVGIQAFNDKTGPIERNSILVAYAYNMPIVHKTRLSTGLFVGAKQLKTNPELWKNIDDETDYLFANEINAGLKPDVHFGMSLYDPNFFANLAVYSLFGDALSPGKINSDGLQKKFTQHFYLSGGLKLYASEKVTVTPSMMLKFVKNAPLSVDVNAKITHSDKFWYGFSYRIMDAANVFVGGEVHHRLYVTYAFEWSYTQIGKFIYGTHEIIVGLRLTHPHNIECPSRYW